MGYLGLFSCINGSLLRTCHCVCGDLCNTRNRLWFSCCYHGCPKNMAETLPYPHKEGTDKGSYTNIFVLHYHLIHDSNLEKSTVNNCIQKLNARVAISIRNCSIVRYLWSRNLLVYFSSCINSLCPKLVITRMSRVEIFFG